MIKLGFVYALAGLMFLGFAIYSARDRDNPKRYGNAAFWGLYAAIALAERVSHSACARASRSASAFFHSRSALASAASIWRRRSAAVSADRVSGLGARAACSACRP